MFNIFVINIYISHIINLEDIKKLPVVDILLDIPRVQQRDVKTDLVDISGRGGGRGGRS